jgi:hypothetical protein
VPVHHGGYGEPVPGNLGLSRCHASTHSALLHKGLIIVCGPSLNREREPHKGCDSGLRVCFHHAPDLDRFILGVDLDAAPSAPLRRADALSSGAFA